MGPTLNQSWGRSFLVLLLLLLTAVPSAADWRRLDTPNFIVIGDVGGNTLRDIALKFEGFRETLGRVLNAQVTATAVPTVVIVFPNERAFRPFMPEYEGRTVDVGGLFVANQDVNYIALTSSGGEEALTVVFHEYAHLIISNVARNIPTWLGEGLAEYYSTFELASSGKQAKLGLAVPWHLLELRNSTMLPLEKLLEVTHSSPLYNEGRRRSVFYAQSWALTHMLLLGQPSRAQQLLEYLSKLGSGVPAMDAWNQVFDTKAIEEALQRYVRLGGFYYRQYNFSERLSALDAKPQPLLTLDAEAFLADFLLLQQRGADALERLAKTPRAGAGSVWSATVAALLDVSKNDYLSGEKRLLGLSDDSDWFAAYRAGAAIAEIVEERREPPTDAQLEVARRLLAAAPKAGREVPNATARLAAIELATDGPPPPALRTAIERARLMAPGRLDYVFLHARILAAQGAFPAARSALAPMLQPAFPQSTRDAARTLMGYIVRLEKYKTDMAAAQTSFPAGSPASGDAAASVAGSGSGFRPDFRRISDGEHRTEGVLVQIECTNAGLTLHVRSSEELVSVTAPDVNSVEFISYREDLAGTVACGPRKDMPNVYVTWRADGAGRRAVAVEFLPK